MWWWALVHLGAVHRSAAPPRATLEPPSPPPPPHTTLEPESQGHIFILNTDLRYLACDVWLCPVSASGFSNEIEAARWRLTPEELPERPDGWGDRVHAVRCRPRTAEAQRARREERHRIYEHPLPILAHVRSEGKAEMPLEERLAALREFLALAADELQGERAHCRFGRALPLISLPIFGAGLAADSLRGADDGGTIVLEMLSVLHEFTQQHAVDIALCTVDEAAFGAALTARRQLLGNLSPDRYGRLWRLKTPDDAADAAAYELEVDRLADRFLDGHVALFLGAGVSINAGGQQ